MSGPREFTVGFDAAWGGTGWAICHEGGPAEVGHLVPDSKAWREAALVTFLRHELEHRIATMEAQLPATTPAPRVVIERLPWSYRRPGSQVRTVFGISGVAHVIMGWACRPTWRYPWLIPPRHDRKGEDPGWREWWGIRGKGRPAKKQAAVDLVRALGWSRFLGGLGSLNAKGDGPIGDVAEAILIGVGAARHPGQAPKGPASWRRSQERA